MFKAVVIIKAVFVFVLFIILIESSFGQKPYSFNLIYDGEMPDKVRGMEKRLMTFNLADYAQDQLLFINNKDFAIYQFNGGKWELRYYGEIDFADFEYKHLKSGDIDNDGDDELLILKNSSITIYNFTDGNFTGATYEFAFYPEDALIGDINNDSSNELVMLCADEPGINDRFDTEYNLCIYNYSDQELDLFWSDNSSLKLSSSNAVVPPQKLMCISDIDNTGYNKLIIPGIQSDVSPTYFNVFYWHESALIRSGSFRITELSDTLITSGFNKDLRKDSGLSREEVDKFFKENRLQRYVFHDMRPGILNNETQLLTDIIEKRVIPVTIKINDNNVIIYRLSDVSINSSWLRWFNIDGQGTGILHTYYPDDSDIACFEFYR